MEQIASASNDQVQNTLDCINAANLLSNNINLIVQNVKSVIIDSEKNMKIVNNSKKIVSTLSDTSSINNKNIANITDTISDLNDSTQNILYILNQINDITEQTNLLALNASIEAARAGESGKGFAVVADQIGKLAGDSAKSAVETRELVIKSLEEVQEVNNITKKAASSFERIIRNMSSFGEETKGVSDNSESQSEMIKKIRKEIEKITSVVETNSASAEESSATSEQLTAQSERLRELVRRFKLKKK